MTKLKKIKNFLSSQMAMDIPIMLYNKKESLPKPKAPKRIRRSFVTIDKFETNSYSIHGYYKSISKSIDVNKVLKSK